MAQSTSGRIEYVDFYRGIGILLMVAAHVGFGGAFNHLIHAFHMPMFFFVSGWFFRPNSRPAWRYLLHKARSLLVPYILWALVFYVVWRVWKGQPSVSFPYLLLHMNAELLESTGPLWFLPALFFADIIYDGVSRLFSNFYVRTAAVVAIALCGNLLHLFVKGPCILAIDAAMVGVGMMHAAYTIRNSRVKAIRQLGELSLLPCLIGAAALAVTIFLNPEINMRTGSYGIVPLFWLNAIGSSVILWNLSRMICPRLKASAIGGFISGTVTRIGKWSLIFLCLNMPVILLVFRIFPPSNHGVMRYLHNPISYLITLLILYLIAFLYHTLKSSVAGARSGAQGRRDDGSAT